MPKYKKVMKNFYKTDSKVNNFFFLENLKIFKLYSRIKFE